MHLIAQHIRSGGIVHVSEGPVVGQTEGFICVEEKLKYVGRTSERNIVKTSVLRV